MLSRHENGKRQNNVIHKLKGHSESAMIDGFICQINGHATYPSWNEDYKQVDIIDQMEM
jgi:hypothetical protein